MTHEIEQNRRDGSTVWTEVVTTLLKNSSGGLDILGVTRDITERMQATEALRERELRLNAVINSTDAVVWSVDWDYCLTMANSVVIRDTQLLYGYELQTGENIFARLPIEMHQEWKDRYDRVLQGESFREEINNTFPSGERLVREYSFNPIINSEGRITGAACFGNDISVRKRAEAALQESEQRNRQLANAMPQLVWTARPDGEIDYVNDRTQEYYGLTAGAEGIYQWLHVVHANDRGTTMENWRHSLQSGEMYQVEHRLKKTDGSYRWHLSRGVPVRGPEGQVIKWFGTSTDIEDNKQAEADLRESEELLRLAQDAAELGTWWTDIDADRYYFDTRASTQYGIGTAQATISEVMTHIHPEDTTRIIREIALTPDSAGQEHFSTEYRVIHADGSVHWLVVQARVFFEGQGANRRPVKMVGTSQDITERKRAEAALQESEQKLRTLFEIVPVGICIYNQQRQIVLANPAVENILRVDRERLLRGEYQDRQYLRADQTPLPPQEHASNRAVEENTPVQNIETGILIEDGSLIWADVSAVPVDFADWQAVVVSLDITERKRANQELHSTAEELARSNAELEQFAYIASHDLKEPLRAVSGMVQLLQRNYQGKLDERADEYIKFAVEGASRMQNLINDLLAFSRVGTQAKAFELTQMEMVLQNAEANLAAALRESGAVLTHDQLPAIYADTMQLTQVLQNLVSNAIKFHGKEPPQIHIAAERAANEWHFSVHDNGIGIDPQYFERIFAVFQRLHTRREYPGTGIGLAICKKIVERHGGRIWVDSQEGQGATFFFTIPDRRSDNPNEPRPQKV